MSSAVCVIFDCNIYMAFRCLVWVSGSGVVVLVG